MFQLSHFVSGCFSFGALTGLRSHVDRRGLGSNAPPRTLGIEVSISCALDA